MVSSVRGRGCRSPRDGVCARLGHSSGRIHARSSMAREPCALVPPRADEVVIICAEICAAVSWIHIQRSYAT